MNEPAEQHSDIIEKLQARIQALADENRLLKERMEEAGISYADIVADHYGRHNGDSPGCHKKQKIF